LERRISGEQQKLAEFQKDGVMLKEEVDEEDVAGLSRSGLAFQFPKCWKAKCRNWSPWKRVSAKRVIGQEEALKAVADAVRRARAGLQDPNRPWVPLFFLGQPALEKQRRRRALAEFLFDDEHAMIRLDMSSIWRNMQ